MGYSINQKSNLGKIDISTNIFHENYTFLSRHQVRLLRTAARLRCKFRKTESNIDFGHHSYAQD